MSWNNEHNLDDANSIIEEAMISAGQPIDPDTQSHLLIIVFDSLVRMGKIGTAKKAADMAFAADRKIDHAYSRGWGLVATTKALVQCGDTEAAKMAADESFAAALQVKEPGPQSAVLVEVVKAMLLVGKINEALIAARMIDETYARPRAFIWIAEAIMRIEDKDEAKAIIDEGLAATGNIPDLLNRLSYISPFYIALTTIERADDAKRVFDEISIMVRKIENPRTRVWGLLSLFESQVKVGKLDEAATILDELYSLMLKVVNPAIIPGDFILLAQAKAKLGKEGEAKRLLNEGSAALQKITDVVRQGKGQVELAKTMIQFGMIDEASNILDDALSSAPTFNQSMASRGDYCYDIIMEIVSALAKIRKLEYALTIASGLKTSDARIRAFRKIARALFDARRIEEAKRLIDDTLVLARKTKEPSFSCHSCPGYQAETLASIAEILVKIEKTEEARMVALEALAGARNISYSEDRVPALIYVAEVLDKCSGKHTKR